MPLGNPTGGASYAAEFQSSGLPWLTSSQAPAGGMPVSFSYVSRFVTFINTDAAAGLQVAVTENGLHSGNSIVVPKGTSLTLEWRLVQLFLASTTNNPCSYSIAAGLTTVRAMDFPQLSGTLADGSKGWPGVG